MKHVIILIISTIFIALAPASAYFFPNVSSIPPSLIPNATVWDAFIDLLGCHNGQKVVGLGKLKTYFHYFGYLDSSYSDFSDEFDDYLESAVKTYQLNFNINVTGVVDASTLKSIMLPRCGNPDIVNGTSTMHSGSPTAPPFSDNATIHTVAHYTFFPNMPRWPDNRRQLRYAFAPENQLEDSVRAVFSRAFERWSEVTALTFTEIANFRGADIRIGFFSGEHGDGEPFDGVLGTLAHAFAPTNGRCHLDREENWVVDGNFINGSPLSAVDLESVVIHEIGHLLGLGHSSTREAIMYPSIASGTRKVELANDDIRGIQALYGSNPNFNGSGPVLTPRQESDTSGGPRRGVYSMSGLIVGLLFLFLFV